MKKAFLFFCMAMSLFATNAFAQLKEVRGVQTRSVQYTEYDEKQGEEVTRWGYELKNENNYTVWVELELKTHGFTQCYDKTIVAGVRDTKNITLKAGETYVWKCGDRMVFWCYGEEDHHEKFHITYKAYKTE